MVYRLPSERVLLDVEGPSVEVERIGAWPIHRTALSLMSAFMRATEPGPELAALAELYPFFLGEAQPVWDIADHRGPVPVSVVGMYRLPIPLALRIVDGWLETFEPDKPSAVDAVIPPGPVRDALNKGLRAKRSKRG